MTSYPDPLFREGLEHYRKPAPASAWERIESGLDKKKHRSPWLKIAAGLILLMATSVLIWKYSETFTSETEVAVGSEQSSVGNGQSAVGSGQSSVGNGQFSVGSQQSAVGSVQYSVSSMQSESIVERSRNNHRDTVHGNPPVEERTGAERSRSSRNDHSRSSRQSTVASLQSTVYSLQSLEKSKDASPDELENKTITQTQVSTVEESIDVVSSESTPDTRGTSISYSADMVNERFIKKDVVAEATPEKKNASGLQKVIEKALDLKNEESILGDLREKKNDWLTINYPAKKRETNK